MDDLSPARRRTILILFWAQVVVFVITLLPMFVPFLEDILPRAMLWEAAILFLLGVGLIWLVLRAPVDRPLKRFLTLTGGSAIGFVVSFLLHNFMFALSILTEDLPILPSLLSALGVVFFLAAVPVFPVTFVIGAVGTVVLLVRRGNTPQHPSQRGLSHVH
jgi:hypothetical protein